MSKRLLHSLLTLVFAFLQCVSPLVHAHAEGEQSGMLHIAAATQMAVQDGLSTDSSAIISLTDDIHRYAQLALPPACSSPFPVQATGVQTHDLPYLSVIRIQRATCCTPPPQAPPILS
ncbi:MAG: hypothetical protein PHH36_02540 [Sideroxydans sp.]|nr:hypothetical protein [Sideroxydans sp.]